MSGSDILLPRVRADHLDTAPKRRGQYVNVVEYPDYSTVTGPRGYGRGQDLEVERSPRVRKYPGE